MLSLKKLTILSIVAQHIHNFDTNEINFMNEKLLIVNCALNNSNANVIDLWCESYRIFCRYAMTFDKMFVRNLYVWLIIYRQIQCIKLNNSRVKKRMYKQFVSHLEFDDNDENRIEIKKTLSLWFCCNHKLSMLYKQFDDECLYFLNRTLIASLWIYSFSWDLWSQVNRIIV